MSSIGKIQAALAAATNEVTVAAANLNFDFTLIKCEAPKEFHQLGSALTQGRKEDAEYGSLHVTARRLGALFQGLLPPTPNLLRAYGKRVSEIAQTSQQNVPPEPENSMFAAHAGIDGTSIWAAATSSPTALHVQLLACMLARHWPASEATSIWVELIQGRRREVEETWNENHAVPYASLTAATQSKISRASLAEWDASARSWLRTADRVKVKHQNQLMLLVANVNVPINEHMTVYQSVIPAWKSALESSEKLIRGMPQATNYGPCLLAISSWHFYPDIIFTGSTTVSHKFEDPLIRPGGTLTLGLARPGGDISRGVFWSLSLAHLNFYARRPVQKEAVLDLNSQKLTFPQLTVSIFGAFLAHWGVLGSDVEAPSRFFVKLRDVIHTTANDEHDSNGLSASCKRVASGSPHPINLLARAADTLLDARKFEDDLDLKLIALGGKKAEKILPEAFSTCNFMGLGDPRTLLSLLKGPDERIALLRRIIADSNPTTQNQGDFLIRFCSRTWSPPLKLSGLANALSEGEALPESEFPDSPLELAGLATALIDREALPEGGFADLPHVRWVPKAMPQGNNTDVVHEIPDEVASNLASQEYTFVKGNTYKGHDELVFETYYYVYGDPHCAAIYSNASDIKAIQADQSLRPPTFQDLIWCLESDLFDIEALLLFLNVNEGATGHLATLPEGQTLKALSTAHKIYQSLPTATVSTRALNRPLHSPRWATNSPCHESSKVPKATEDQVSLNVAFSCIAWLEAGIDLDPGDLAQVFALAYEDSIYVSMNLTCDPWEMPRSHELKRVAGNVGKPGLTLLVPPNDPVVPEVEESSWRILGTSEFNGLAEDRFSQTTMHLSFTEYYFPLVQVGDGQGQDKQVHYLESIISIHHAGEWIGDVDLQKCLASTLLTRSPRTTCREDCSNSSFKGIRSVESWEDVIDPPAGDVVVRAHGNWVARLATTTVMVHLREATAGGIPRKVVVFPNDTCWNCIRGTDLSAPMDGFNKQLTSYIPGTFSLMVF